MPPFKPITPQLGIARTNVTPAVNYAALTSTQSKQKLLDAVRYAHEMWRMQAHFRNITITAVTANGPPSCLTGPALGPLIASAPGVAADTGAAADLRNAVADGVSQNFAMWQNGVTVPGLPWYPTFAAFPGPVAPPTPNVPMPLAVCPSINAGKLSEAALTAAITAALPPALRVTQVEACAGALARSLANYFTMWLPMQLVQSVMGQGPVPSFAPPMVPVGPVVGGSVIPAPGHLMAGGQPMMIVM